jgi:hypothetical protein
MATPSLMYALWNPSISVLFLIALVASTYDGAMM